MNINRRQLSRPMWALLLLGAAIGSGSALAAGKTGATGTTDAAARYQQERAVCLSGQSSQDRATCLREASAAFAEAKRGALDDGSAAYERNARERCNKLAEADRNACIARMQGQGTTSGSVAAGGIYRELVTRETVVPSPAKPEVNAPGGPTK